MDEKPKKTDDSGMVQRGSLAMGIPMMLLAGPITGIILAYFAIKVFRLEGNAAKWTQVGLVLLGLASAGRETIKIIQRISKG